ncbi:hypothetical protein [Arthrobacter sp. zg-Y1171]|uniref:hypothetical protein n=1 Tax=Arthrobacter sp. zg-Y1171 TaxID=2964610 RepID=UPI0021053981|nr:hypothetical protein [Arthrobacter sp. zg-Y1171]MCQ1995532.1 hypothetical protein [Arthrobacter sp. zg-Y1171]UWX80441.1 hypothetical protein N2L00_08255 [Arthrobacter sp. zg-Y1171]
MPEQSLPPLYAHMIECGVVDLDPWHLLRGETQVRRARHIEQVFPGWGIVPFARRTDNDDVACWTGSSVVVIDDWDVWSTDGKPIRHVQDEYPSMEEWLLAAVRDFVEFDWS